MAAWSGFEPTDGGIPERARARIRDSALYSPLRYRKPVDELPREGAQPEPGAERGRELRQALAEIDRATMRLLEPQHEAQLVEREGGQVGAGDEGRRADDAVPQRASGDELLEDRAA